MKDKILMAILLFVIGQFACIYGQKMAQGNRIVVKVEKFKSDKGRLPNNLTEIGIIEDESGPIYYEKKTETKYILWFGKELGESMTYDSETKQWK
jgi:hypothetical protein